MPYTSIGAVVKLVERFKGRILDMDHGEKAKAVVLIRCSEIPSLEENIKAISGEVIMSASK